MQEFIEGQMRPKSAAFVWERYHFMSTTQKLIVKPLPGTKSRELLHNPDRGFRYELMISLHDAGEYPDNDRSVSFFQLAEQQFDYYEEECPQVAQLYIYMSDYMERDLDDTAINNLCRCFDFLAERQLRVLIRFAYQHRYEPDSSKPIEPCADQIFRHLDQLQPIIEKYRNLIYAVQAGFVGIWGEWHSMIALSREDQKAILEKLVDILPPELFVQVRYMWIKNLLDKDDPRRSRIGYHDDYIMDRPVSWSSAANAEEWEIETAESPYLVNDAEMPWGIDEVHMGPMMNPAPLMLRMYQHCFATMSVKHNYRENGECFDMEEWKKYPATYTTLYCSDFPYADAWLHDENGEEIDRSFFEYIRDYMGYYIEASDAAVDIGDKDVGDRQVNLQISLKNYGTAAPLTMHDPEAVIVDAQGKVLASAVLCCAAELLTGKTVQAEVTLEIDDLPPDAALGIRFVNPMGTPARLANDLRFENGINLLGKLF